MSKARPIGLAALSCAALLLLVGCGGGGGSAGASDPTLVPHLELVPQTTADEPLPSGSVQPRVLELRNTGSAPARGLRVEVAAGAHVLHLPLLCEGALATACKQSADGALEIAELPAGAVLTLRQRLRVDGGFSGSVRNDWRVSAASIATPLAWTQNLAAHVADLAVSVQAPAIDGETGVLSYGITLKNEGPDEARDATWRLQSAPGMALLDVQCSAEGAATCPAVIGERIRLERLPKGSGLVLKARYAPRKIEHHGREAINFLTSEVSVPGDGNPVNDRASHRQDQVMDNEDHYTVQTLHGDRFELAYEWGSGKSVRFSNDVFDLRYATAPDVTGYLMLGTWDEVHDDPLRVGGLQLGPSRGLVAGAADLGDGRRPFIGASRFISSMAELEGLSFNLLGSKADRAGRPLDAFVWPARFTQGALELCVAARPTRLEACAAADRQRWVAALVGKELELVGPGGKVVRLLAARTPTGPVLITNGAGTASDGSREFWLVLPGWNASRDWASDPFAAETTFGGETGLAFPGFGEFEVLGYPDSVSINAVGLPNVVFLYHKQHPEVCLLNDARFARTEVPALFAGDISASSRQAPCWRGASYAVMTGEIRVVLGAADGPLKGGWLFSVRP